MLPPAPPTVVKPDAIWKIQTALTSPCASSVRLPDAIESVDVDLYIPGASVLPPWSPDTVTGAGDTLLQRKICIGKIGLGL
jgi:hypothetical protein